MLLERAEELGVLQRLLGQVASTSRGKIVLVTGEAGTGKTALLQEFSGSLADSARLLRAACDPLFTPRPLGPLLDLAAVTGGDLAASIGPEARPFELAAALMRELKSAGPTTLVLEDIHWADAATLDVVRMLARRLHQAAMLLVLTYRDDEIGRSHPLRIVLGDLPSADVGARIEVGSLSPEAVAVLAGPAGVNPVDLHDRTAGNPFFVTEVLAAGTERIPATVRDAVLARTARLAPRALEVLDVVAVVPGRAEQWLVEALVADETAADLDECLESGILTAAAGWVAFRHEIGRFVVEDSLPPGRRAGLHRRVLAALANPPAGQPDMARLAHHAEAAGDGEAVLRYAMAAGEQAAAAGARREAVGEFARALRFAGRLAPQERAWLLERFAAEGYFTDSGEDVTSALQKALAIYRENGDLLGQGRVMRRLGRQLGLEGHLLESRAVQLEAVAVLEQLPPGAELARTYASLSANYAMSDEAEAIAWGGMAIALAQEIGCTDALIYALNNVGTTELRRGDPEGLEKLERSRELAESSGDAADVGRSLIDLSFVFVICHDWPRADGYIRAGIAHCHRHGFDQWLDWLVVLRGQAELARGNWTAAISSVRPFLEVMSQGFSRVRCTALIVTALAQARRGESGYWPLLDEARELVKAVSVPQARLLVAAARAEAAWLEDASAEQIDEETGEVLAYETGGVSWFGGEIACWRWRAGLPAAALSRLGEPYRLEIAREVSAAARWWKERGCRYEAALVLAGSSGDADALREALHILHDLGARRAAAIVARRLRALGERGVPRGPRPVTVANPVGLTERELQVLALLAGGLSNTEIATRLIVSARTVDHHVASILRKLGAPKRAEAISAAIRLGLTGPAASVPGAAIC